MNTETTWLRQNGSWLLPFLYFFGRLVLFLALFPHDHRGFGDFPVYSEWSALPGWPILDYWMEYPPIFPFISETVYRLSGALELFYDFILSMLLAVCGAVSIYLFQKIAARLWNESAAFYRTLVYFALVAVLPYTWWVYEPLPVMLMLGGLLAVLQRKDTAAGVWIGLGILAKWFPIFLLPALLRYRPIKSTLKIAAIAFGMTILVWGALHLASPEYTRASLLSQPGRSSWQTIWAMIDGNKSTGAYVITAERYILAAAIFPRGNPPVVPPLLTLALFGTLGAWLIWRVKSPGDRDYLALVGITWAVFILWSPGWSPQWILYLVPLILLTLPLRKSLLLNLLLITLTIIEWPLMLSRHLFDSLWVIAPLRMALLVWVVVLLSSKIKRDIFT